MFLDMLEAGLVARKSLVVSWDPVDNLVLANEQARGSASSQGVDR